jgi:nucleoside-diphosphate-sugar epimerase
MARRLGDLGARGDGYCNLVYIDDLVRAVAAAVTQPNVDGHAFNIAMSDPPTWNEYFIRFGQMLGGVPVRRVTQRRMKIETKLLAIPLKVGEIALGKIGLASAWPPAIPPSLLDLCRQEIRLDVTRAESALGLRWTPLEEGLRQTAAALGRAAAVLAESY